MKGLHLNGTMIDYMKVDESTDCLGVCLNMNRCVAFNAYMINQGKHLMCEFLADIRCGFIEDNELSSIFVQHFTCEFSLKAENKFVTKNNKFIQVKKHAQSLKFQINIDGTGFKANGKCIFKHGKYLKLSETGSENQCYGEKWQFVIVGDANKFQLKNMQSNECIAKKKIGFRLVHNNCDRPKPYLFTINYSSYL